MSLIKSKNGFARLYQYMAFHQIEVIHQNEDQFLKGILYQLNAELIEPTPTLISILEQIYQEE